MLLSLLLLAPVLYLDPGSGSVIFQMIVAALLGAGIIIRSQWARIKGWFGIKSKNKDDNESDEEAGG